MKIALVNTYDIQGGAARAAYRLHQGFQRIGQDSVVVSRFKVSSDNTVIQVAASPPDQPLSVIQQEAIQSHHINLNRSGLTDTIFSFPYPGFDISSLEAVQQADIINLHWIAQFQSPITLKAIFDLGKPVVWTLHDCWAFTGGCHYSAGCPKYQLDCSRCPQLQTDPFNIAAAILHDKAIAFKAANLTIVSPSQWLANCARESQLFQSLRVEAIPNSLETEVFVPQSKAIAKAELGIHPDTITLLFGADSVGETRKGFNELLAATGVALNDPMFQSLAAAGKVEILCFGYPSPLLKALPIPVRSFGHITSDSQLSLIYSAADVFVLPSLEDNLPNTMLEALSCGTAVIGFDVGGIPDLVKDGVTGRLVPFRDLDQLAEALLDCVVDPERYRQMGQTGRQWIETHHPLRVQAERYLALFQELLVTSGHGPIPRADTESIDRQGGVSMSALEPEQLSVALDTTVGDRLRQRIDQLALEAVTQKLTYTQADLNRTQADLIHTQEQWQHTQRELERTQQDLQTTQQDLQRTQQDLQATQQDLQTTQQSLQLRGGEGQSEALQRELEATQQTLQQLQDESQQYRSTIQRLQGDLKQMQVAVGTEKQAANDLRNQIQSLNTSRARIIQELQQGKEQLNQRVRELRQENRQFKRENRDLQQSVEHLEQEVAYLSTGKAAIRKLIKVGLKKTGIYGFVYRHYKTFVPLYNLLLFDRWKPATIQAEAAPGAIAPTDPSSTAAPPSRPAPSPPALSQPSVSKEPGIDMQSPLVEAAVLARALDMALDTPTAHADLEWLAEGLTTAQSALLVNPDRALAPVLQAMLDRRIAVTVVGDADAIAPYLYNGVVESVPTSLGEWLKASPEAVAQYDVVGLGRSRPADWILLRGRLSSRARVFTSGMNFPETGDRPQPDWGAPQIRTPEVWIYGASATPWQRPAWYPTAADPYRQWPWNAPVTRLPATLPSGHPWPKISVITVTYNQGAYIEETLRSVLNQGYPNLEYIVIDGGSTDGTRAILERYQSELTDWVSESDNGQSDALNKGFRRATGDILAWLNSDDIYLPGTLAQVAIAFDTYNTDMVVGGCQLRQGNCPTPFKTHHSALPVGAVTKLPLERLLDIDHCWFKGEFFYQPEVFWTRDLWNRAGGEVDESLFYSMDYDLWVRMAIQQATVVHLPDPLCLFRMHENQKTYGESVPYLPELKGVSAHYSDLYQPPSHDDS